MKKTIVLLMSLVMTNVMVSQEKIGNKVFFYGNLEGSIVGKTLIYFGVNDPKSEMKIIKSFKELGINSVSWNNMFIPGTTYTDSERNSEINRNEIITIIIIKPNGTSYSTQSNYNTTYSSYTNSLNTAGSSGGVLGRMGLVFEVYNRTDNFNKPRAVINASADNMWGAAGSQSGLTLKVVDKVLSALKDKKAYNPKGDFLNAEIKNADSIFNLGVLSANAKNYTEAEKYYYRVIEIDPNYNNAYKNLAILKLDGEKVIIDEMNKLSNSPNDDKRYNELKTKREDLFRSVIPLLQKAIELDPSQIDIQNTLLGIYTALGMIQESNGLKNKVNIDANQRLKTSELLNYWNNGVELYRKKDYQNAILNFSKYLEIEPYATDALFFRALSKTEIQDRNGAINDYDKILPQEGKVTPKYYKFSTIYNNKAFCLVELGNYKDALPLVNKALELDQTEAYIWDTRGELNYKLGQYQKCIDDMDKAIIIQKNNNSYFYRGLAKIKLAKKTEGCEDLKLSQELGKKEALLELGKYCK
jgi:tetratricopeptide (TPR) repeat protein